MSMMVSRLASSIEPNKHERLGNKHRSHFLRVSKAQAHPSVTDRLTTFLSRYLHLFLTIATCNLHVQLAQRCRPRLVRFSVKYANNEQKYTSPLSVTREQKQALQISKEVVIIDAARSQNFKSISRKPL